MGHVVHIQSKEQYMAALDVLNFVSGTWHARGPSTAPVLLLTDDQYKALADAGVVSANGQEENARGKKSRQEKTKS